MFKRLFSYTQTTLAKRIVACLILPLVLHQVVEKSLDVFHATVNLAQTMGFWQSLPYVVSCALVMVITRLAVIFGHRLRRDYTPN
jgi:flagellar biosynthesis protein FlhB